MNNEVTTRTTVQVAMGSVGAYYRHVVVMHATPVCVCADSSTYACNQLCTDITSREIVQPAVEILQVQHHRL